MGTVAFISDTQRIKTVAAQTDSQSHYLTLQNVVTVWRAMGGFFPLAVCLFKGGYVSWVQAVHELGFNCFLILFLKGCGDAEPASN